MATVEYKKRLIKFLVGKSKENEKLYSRKSRDHMDGYIWLDMMKKMRIDININQGSPEWVYLVRYEE